jgi:hypothetical protein
MAIENFKPTIWRARLLSNLQKAHVLAGIANREYEGEITASGDTVKIGSIGRITVNDYDGSVSYEELEDASIKLQVDQEKYFAFKVDDVDAAQSNANQMNEAMEEASYSLSDASDQFLAGFYTDAANTVTEGSFNSSAVYETVTEVGKTLQEENVPADLPKWMVVKPSTYQKMLLAEIDKSTDNISTLGEGAVMHTMGFDVFVSNNLTNDMAGTYRSLAFVEQILDTESLRLEGSFSDAVRGLYVYGAKVVRPNELVNLDLTIASE